MIHTPTLAGRADRQSLPWTARMGLSLAAASAVGVLFAGPDWGHGTGWQQAVLLTLCDWWAWGCLAPAVIALDGKLRAVASTAVITGMHVLLGSTFSIAHACLRAAMGAVFGLSAWSVLAPASFVPGLFKGAYFWGLLVYALLVGLAQAYHYRLANQKTQLDMARLERSFAEARLHALRMQLDPHFLFNALNTISAQISPSPKLARQMIGHLGDLLRASLDSGDRSSITLAEELVFLDHYLAIQTLRFGENLRVHLDIDEDARRAHVPNLLMQPLVENAIRHGISPRAQGGTLTLTAARSGETLVIHVIDDGIGLPPGWALDTSAGLGLSITRERVAGLRPGATQFEVRRRAAGGTDVLVVLPFLASVESP